MSWDSWNIYSYAGVFGARFSVELSMKTGSRVDQAVPGRTVEDSHTLAHSHTRTPSKLPHKLTNSPPHSRAHELTHELTPFFAHELTDSTTQPPTPKCSLDPSTSPDALGLSS